MALLPLIRSVIKSKTFSTLSVFASANMVATALSGIGGVLQARWVTPELLGSFQKFGIPTTYLAFAMIVVIDGLSRQFPYLIGKGKRDEAMAVAAVAKCWCVVIALLMAGVFAILSITALFRANYLSAAGWGVQIIAIVGGTYGIYLQTIYRRSMEFKRLSYNGLITSVIGFGSLVFVNFLGFYGLAVKSLLTNGTRVLFDAHYIPVKIKMNWDRNRFLDLVKISVPLSLEGYIRTSFMSATFGFLVVRYCGERDLGLYGIAVAFESFALLFVNSMTQIFDVKMANRFGENDSVANGAKALLIPTSLGVLCSFVFAIGLCAAIGPFIRIFVPAYSGAIPIVYILAVDLPLSVMLMPTRLLRVALMYKSIYLISIIRIISLLACVCLVPPKIEWFAGSKMIANGVAMCFGYWFLWRTICLERNRTGANLDEDIIKVEDAK